MKWKKKKLSEFCEFSNGLWTGKKPPFKTVGVIRNTNFTKDCQLDDSDIVYLEVEQSQFQKRKLQYGDIILEKSGGGPKQPVGRVVIFDKTEGDFSFSNFTSVIRIKNKKEVDFNFLHRYLFLEYISGATEKMQSHSTGIRNLKFDEYKEIEIPLPSLPEQQRIVSILDEVFAAISKAKANADQNLKNAKELFESYLQGVFENGNWEEKELGDLCLLITKGSSPKWQGIKYVDEPGILFVTSENVGEGKMLLNERKYVEEKFNLKDKKSILKKGDVLTNIVGASIGRTAIYDIDDVANINQAVCILRCNPKYILNNYLMNLLNSPFLKKILHDNEVNTARANLSLGFFNKLSIPCPTIAEQQTIVRQLDALRAETQKLEAVYQKKIDDLEELKKSILQKAFVGELKTEKVEKV